MSKCTSATETRRKGGLRSLLGCRRGTAAIEFAILLPVILVISVAGLEFALIMFEYHLASEATRRAARVAIIEPPIASIDEITTSGVTCTYAGGSPPSCSGATTSSTATATFDKIADAVAELVPSILTDPSLTLSVTYRDTGLTDSGTTNVYTPSATVRLTGLKYEFFAAGLVGVSGFEFPGFDTTRVGPSEVPS